MQENSTLSDDHSQSCPLERWLHEHVDDGNRRIDILHEVVAVGPLGGRAYYLDPDDDDHPSQRLRDMCDLPADVADELDRHIQGACGADR